MRLRASYALVLAAAPVGYFLGRAFAFEQAPPAGEAAPVAVPDATARRCPVRPPEAEAEAASAPLPVDWDPLADEAHFWDEVNLVAVELGGGSGLTIDCARWPCLAAIALPDESKPAFSVIRDRVAARFPGSTARQSGWRVDGASFDVWTIILGQGSLPDDVAREVALRRIAFDLEVEAAVDDWLAAGRAEEAADE